MDIRPFVATQVRRYIDDHPESKDSEFSPAGWVLNEAMRACEHMDRSKMLAEFERSLPDDGRVSDYFENIVKSWGRFDSPGKRGKPRLAEDTFLWFFKYVEDTTYFSEVARHIWPTSSLTFQRFIYAKCGGLTGKNFEQALKRFHASSDEVRREFPNLWVFDDTAPVLTFESSESSLHYANRRIRTPLGREKEQERLRDFLGADGRFLWMQLAGVAGQGKSRLAFELAMEVQGDWSAGFLNETNLASFKDSCEHWQPEKPTLIVVDYVLASTRVLKFVFQALARRCDELHKPVRLLLIERQRWDRGGLQKRTTQSNDGKKKLQLTAASEGRAAWFLELCKRSIDGGDTNLSETRYENGVLELGALSPDDLVSIMRQEASLSGRTIRYVDDWLKKHLERIDGEGRPLFAFILAQSLLAGTFRIGFGKTDLLTDELLRNRTRRWSTEFGGIAPMPGEDSLSVRLAVLASMLGGIDYRHMSTPSNWEKPTAETFREAVVLNDGPQGSGVGLSGAVPEMQPDILAEWYVLSTFSSGLTNVAQICEIAWKTSPADMAFFLLRCAQDFPSHDEIAHLFEVIPNKSMGLQEFMEASALVVSVLRVSGVKSLPRQLKRALLLAVEEGNCMAMNTLGNCRLEGCFFEKDQVEAAHLFGMAAEKGDPMAMSNLGVCYARGTGLKRDEAKAFLWFEKSAAKGVPEAMHCLGICYAEGIGVPSNKITAFHWFEEAASYEVPKAMYEVAVCYADGIGVDVDHDNAISWFERATVAGHPNAMVRLACYLVEGKNTAKDQLRAFELFTIASQADDPQGMMNLAVCYQDGVGVEVDLSRAIHWYELAADVGHEDAMTNLGLLFARGKGTDIDMEAAFYWFHKAAKIGASEGMLATGICYLEGHGVATNQKKALLWFQRAAEAGHFAAMCNLGICYADGIGLEVDSIKAFQWFERAALGGHADGMTALAQCYRHGVGVEIDKVKARDWNRKARKARYRQSH